MEFNRKLFSHFRERDKAKKKHHKGGPKVDVADFELISEQPH